MFWIQFVRKISLLDISGAKLFFWEWNFKISYFDNIRGIRTRAIAYRDNPHFQDPLRLERGYWILHLWKLLNWRDNSQCFTSQKNFTLSLVTISVSRSVFLDRNIFLSDRNESWLKLKSFYDRSSITGFKTANYSSKFNRKFSWISR